MGNIQQSLGSDIYTEPTSYPTSTPTFAPTPMPYETSSVFTSTSAPTYNPNLYDPITGTSVPITEPPVIYDPNLGSSVPVTRTRTPSVRLPFPTMTPSSTSYTTSISNNYCSTDEDCMNIDEYTSTADNIVYSCPEAKCVANRCNCGSKCKGDPMTGRCCQGFETIRGDTFCIENTAIPGLAAFKWNMKYSGQAFSNKHLKKPIKAYRK